MRNVSFFISGFLVTWTCGLIAQPTPTFRAWNQPVPPFRIAGQLYYVGMSQVTSLLITTKEGHILIDGGFAESAPVILENVRKLGFRPEDIRILLSTHAHFDHAGGLAEIKAKTKARLYSGTEDSVLLARGGRQDFAFGDSLTFPPVSADVVVKDSDEVVLGDAVIRAVSTPGHTKGCTAWSFTVRENAKLLKVVMIGGMSAPDYQLVVNKNYPQIAADFETTFRKLKGLECDIPLEGHGFFFGLEEKAAGKRSFVDPEGYCASVAKAETAFHTELEQQLARSTK
jgi:metallo-beta-lactamase class B